MPEKLAKFPIFYTIFARKNARLHNKTTRSRPGRGQMFEAEAEAKASRLRPRPKFWPRGHFGLEDLTLLQFAQVSADKDAAKVAEKGRQYTKPREPKPQPDVTSPAGALSRRPITIIHQSDTWTVIPKPPPL